METNVVVHGSALVIAIILVLFWGKGDFKSIKDVNKLYLLGGALGIIITLTVMLSIKSLGTTLVSISPIFSLKRVLNTP